MKAVKGRAVAGQRHGEDVMDLAVWQPAPEFMGAAGTVEPEELQVNAYPG